MTRNLRHPFGPFMPGIIASTQPEAATPSKAVQDLLKRPVESFVPAPSAANQTPSTYAALLLDESGSMAHHRASALEGFNSQVRVIQDGARQAGNTRVSLTTFNVVAKPLLVARPSEELQPLAEAQYNPSGSTALFDAIGQTLEALLEQPDIHNEQTAILVAIFTDGEENASRRYSAATLKELVTRLEATGRWTFTLMGPHGTSMELASILNLRSGNVAQFNPQDKASTVQAFASMTKAATSYMSMRSMGVMASASLYADVEQTSADETK